ncbi:serine/threonine protein kinase [Roseivivax marinus]|uniref:Serine/threonine protein kinase n=1 Tax=Roseivivax marinus TaxID=1379903 RepID=W4HLG5_9RHOB|nr:hypothetical protein [Roseivivax marinus]ETW12931.1 serine/threonine protein kinase [Roseivivax marinus]
MSLLAAPDAGIGTWAVSAGTSVLVHVGIVLAVLGLYSAPVPLPDERAAPRTVITLERFDSDVLAGVDLREGVAGGEPDAPPAAIEQGESPEQAMEAPPSESAQADVGPARAAGADDVEPPAAMEAPPEIEARPTTPGRQSPAAAESPADAAPPITMDSSELVTDETLVPVSPAPSATAPEAEAPVTDAQPDRTAPPEAARLDPGPLLGDGATAAAPAAPGGSEVLPVGPSEAPSPAGPTTAPEAVGPTLAAPAIEPGPDTRASAPGSAPVAPDAARESPEDRRTARAGATPVPSPFSDRPTVGAQATSPRARPETPSRQDLALGDLISRIRSTPADPCLAALPRRDGADGVGLALVAAEDAAMSTFADALLTADDAVRQSRTLVDPRQCPALGYVRENQDYPASRLGLSLDRDVVQSGASIRGQVRGARGRYLTLLLVDTNGVVQDLQRFVTFSGDVARFEVPVTRVGAQRDTRQMLLALASSSPLTTIRDRAGQRAREVFAGLTGEEARGTLMAIATFDVR